jgi:outer membrane protein assembly factor BamD
MNALGCIGRFIVVGMVLPFLIGGCSHFGKKEEKTATELMSEGMKSFEKGNYEAAAETFQKVKDRYPYNTFAIIAELKMADSLYKRKVYEEAYEAYDEFERLHPKNENIPYVIYQKGMCHFRQLKTIDRDQSHTLKSKEEFERLVKRFPRDDYAKRARKNIRKCLVYLAEYELYVGHFYYKMEKYRAAMARYTYLMNTYPDMGQYHEALAYIRRCKEELSKETSN